MKRRRAVGAARRPPNDAPERRSDADDFVEAVGALLQRRGFPRMAGRIFGQLLLSDPEQPSAAELAARLGASRGSISGMTRLLLAAGLIGRAHRLGERSGRYRLARRPWQALLRTDLEAVREVRHIAERAMRVRGARGGAAGELRDVYLLLERQLERELDRGGPEGPGEARAVPPAAEPGPAR